MQHTSKTVGKLSIRQKQINYFKLPTKHRDCMTHLCSTPTSSAADADEGEVGAGDGGVGGGQEEEQGHQRQRGLEALAGGPRLHGRGVLAC